MMSEELESFIKRLEIIAQKHEYKLDTVLVTIKNTIKYNERLQEDEIIFSIICSYIVSHGILQKKFGFLHEFRALLLKEGLLCKIEQTNSFRVFYSDNIDGKKQKTFMSLERYVDFLEELENKGVEYSVC